MVESGVSFAAVTGKDEYHGGLEMVDDPVKRIQIERFERLANGTREQQFALYQDILNDKPEVAKVPYTSKRTFMPRFETLLQQELRKPVVRVGQISRERGLSLSPEEIPSAKALIKWMQENLFEGKGKERKCKLLTVTEKDAKTLIKMLKEHDARRDKSPKIAKGSKKAAEAAAVEGNEYVQAERATHAAILYSISLDQHARRENMKIDSTWTAAVDEHQKGLSEALATYKGKALKGKGKGKEVEVADAPVSLLEKWEKSPVSQDDDDILDVNDEIAKGKRLRKQLAVQPRDLDEMSKALVHRNRVWTRNLFVGPQKLLARDLHLSRAEQNATIFANSESDYGHDKLVIPVWRYSFQFLADRCPNTFHDWMKKEGTQRQLAQLFGEMGGARTMKAGYARAMTDKEIDIYLRTSSAKGMAEAASTAVLTGRADLLDDLKPVDVRKAALLDSLCKSAWEMAPSRRSHRCRQPFAAFSCWTGTTLPHSSNR
eukprot:jgi/Mesvir1/20757/Mv20079-RA.1